MENDHIMDDNEEINDNLQFDEGDERDQGQGRRGRQENDRVDLEEPHGQRQRLILQPFDNSVTNNVVFTNSNFSEVSITTLKSENAFQHRLNLKYIDVQLVRLITSNQTGVNVYSRIRNKNGYGNNNNNNQRFSRLFLCRVFSQRFPEDNNQLVYIMEARNENINLWRKNTNHRDNGAVSIGCFIRLVSPLPIKFFMQGEIPLIRSPMPAILLRTPSYVSTVSINEEIEANQSFAFVYNRTQLTVVYSAPIKTSCTGRLCDRQRVNDWMNIKGCGCYGMNPNSTSLVFQHAISINGALSEELTMEDFSSFKFMQLYLNGDIPGSCKLYMLQMTEAAMNLYIAIENCMNFINQNGGFTIFGWYKRGSINDKGLTNGNDNSSNANHNNNNNNNENAVQVDAGDLSTHIVSIVPTNHDLLSSTSVLGRRLHRMKFDPTTIESTST